MVHLKDYMLCTYYNIHVVVCQQRDPKCKKVNKNEERQERYRERAIIAIARMILTAVYHMLKTGESWNPCDLDRFDMPQELHERQQKQAINQAVNFFLKHGVILPENVRLTAA